MDGGKKAAAKMCSASKLFSLSVFFLFKFKLTSLHRKSTERLLFKREQKRKEKDGGMKEWREGKAIGLRVKKRKMAR